VSTLAGDYLAICDAAVEDPYAEAAAHGIRAILSGERRRFDLAEDRPDRLNPPNGVWSLCGVGSKLK
jgi:hypothetical protein